MQLHKRGVTPATVKAHIYVNYVRFNIPFIFLHCFQPFPAYSDEHKRNQSGARTLEFVVLLQFALPLPLTLHALDEPPPVTDESQKEVRPNNNLPAAVLKIGQ